jgi:alpha-ketoglutarate-dependent taurine dioxygenase
MRQRFSIDRLTPAIGALVSFPETAVGFGSSLADPSFVDELHAALMEHQVLIVPDAHLAHSRVKRLYNTPG